MHWTKSVFAGARNRTKQWNCAHHSDHLIDEGASRTKDQRRSENHVWQSRLSNLFFGRKFRDVVPARVLWTRTQSRHLNKKLHTGSAPGANQVTRRLVVDGIESLLSLLADDAN